MSHLSGRKLLAIPGPSVIPDQVLQAMHQPGPNIYAAAHNEMLAGVMADLKTVARTVQNAAMYIGNGHAVWEAALANVLSAGDRVLVLATGRFAHGWAAMATTQSIETVVLDFGLRAPVDMQQVTQALTDDKQHRFKAVLAVHVDTATSVLNDVSALRQALDAADHPALLMVDCIASLGCDRFETDAWGVDVMVAACQKGLMTPPGMGFVFFSDRAAEVRNSKALVSTYWDWNKRAAPDEFYQYFCGTPPTHHIYGLQVALQMILEEGIENVWRRHGIISRAVATALDNWGSPGPVEMNITEPQHRSCAVTAVRIGAPDGTRVRDWVEEHCGVTLGIGLGMADNTDPAWHGFFRIGHMGHMNGQMIMAVLGSIDMALKALAIPHGSGALEKAASVVATLSDDSV